jgi:hypothetical protein
MKTHQAIVKASGIIPTLLLLILPALAESPSVASDDAFDADPNATSAGTDDQPAVLPAEGAVYARLRQFEGGISLKREDENASQDLKLEINSPLIPGDQIWTGEDGRLEIQLADGSLLRLDHDSQLSLLNLADREATFDNTTLIRLLTGSLYVRADSFDAHNRRFQIDTPAGSVFLLSGGVYRLDVGADGVSTVASYRGVAEILADDVSVMAHSGERVTAEPGHRPADARAFNTLHRDPFDVWAEDRDDAYASNDSSRGVRPAVPEQVAPYAGELDRYGSWRTDPVYGTVWAPSGVSTDWKPYYYGQWYSAPIGMTWVSSEPWGWAPYHYGRWQWGLGVGWFWIPGVVYSGAYVSWSVGPAAFGWCPLGFYDTPVVVGGIYPWVYVPHTYIYADNIYRHTYAYSDVSRYRLEQNNIVLRQQLYARPGARPEIFGAATYRGALANPRLVQSRTGVSVGGGTSRTPFSVTEQRAYRRAILDRQTPAQRQDMASGGRYAGPAGARQSSGWAPPHGSSATGGDSRMLNRHEIGLRPGVVPPRRASSSYGQRAGDASLSPATGRPIRPPVRMGIENERPSSVTPGLPPQAGTRQDGNAMTAPRMGPVVHRSQSPSPTAPPTASQRPGPSDRQSATPHPRADASRRGTGGPFVMPTRSTSASPSHPGASHAPSHPAARPQVAEKPKGGGKRR